MWWDKLDLASDWWDKLDLACAQQTNEGPSCASSEKPEADDGVGSQTTDDGVGAQTADGVGAQTADGVGAQTADDGVGAQTADGVGAQTADGASDVPYNKYVQQLDLHGGSIRRSSMRNTSKPKLSKWEILSSCPGVIVYKGFDDMPLNPALEEKRESRDDTIRVVTAGLFGAAYR